MEPIVHGPKLVTENASHCLQLAVWRGMLVWMCAVCDMVRHVGVDVRSLRYGAACWRGCAQFAVWRGMLAWMCAVCGMVWYVGVDVHVSEREGEQCCNVVGLSPGPCSLPPLSTPFSC